MLQLRQRRLRRRRARQAHAGRASASTPTALEVVLPTYLDALPRARASSRRSAHVRPERSTARSAECHRRRPGPTTPTTIRHQAKGVKPWRPTKSTKRPHDDQRRTRSDDDEADRDDRRCRRRRARRGSRRSRDEGAEHCRDREEERKFRRRPLLAAHQQRAGDRRAGARNAGDDGETLEEADRERQPRAGSASRPGVAGCDVVAVERGERDAADDQHDADQDGRIEQHRLDEIVEQQPDHRRGGRRPRPRSRNAARPGRSAAPAARPRAGRNRRRPPPGSRRAGSGR